MADKKDIDEISGVETTGHEWDGLKELNNPLPRWWLWVLYATIIWAVGYWILMPSWPLINDHTRGLLGHSDRAVVVERIEALEALRRERGGRLIEASLDEVVETPALLEFAMASGRGAFGDNCAGCHGAGGAGAPGYPNLNDDNWLWGGTLEDIQESILYGIRSDHPQTRLGDMPAFGRDGILDIEEMRAVAAYVRGLSGLEVAEGADLDLGATVYADYCAACHGPAGEGSRDLGAPDLSNNIWLYGADVETIVTSVREGRASVMPAWEGRLDPVTTKALAVYVHSLGGGE